MACKDDQFFAVSLDYQVCLRYKLKMWLPEKNLHVSWRDRSWRNCDKK